MVTARSAHRSAASGSGVVPATPGPRPLDKQEPDAATAKHTAPGSRLKGQ
jgi:hypothetical protein